MYAVHVHRTDLTNPPSEEQQLTINERSDRKHFMHAIRQQLEMIDDKDNFQKVTRL